MTEPVSLPDNAPKYEFESKSQKKGSLFSFGSNNRLYVNITSDERVQLVADCAAKKLKSVTSNGHQEQNKSQTEQLKKEKLKQAKKISSESSILPFIFKRTFVVVVNNEYYEVNANSLEKNFGITKTQLKRKTDRDITDLLKTSVQNKIIAQQLGVDVETFNKYPLAKQSCYQCIFESDPVNGIDDFNKNSKIDGFIQKVNNWLDGKNNKSLEDYYPPKQKEKVKAYLLEQKKPAESNSTQPDSPNSTPRSNQDIPVEILEPLNLTKEEFYQLQLPESVQEYFRTRHELNQESGMVDCATSIKSFCKDSSFWKPTQENLIEFTNSHICVKRDKVYIDADLERLKSEFQISKDDVMKHDRNIDPLIVAHKLRMTLDEFNEKPDLFKKFASLNLDALINVRLSMELKINLVQFNLLHENVKNYLKTCPISDLKECIKKIPKNFSTMSKEDQNYTLSTIIIDKKLMGDFTNGSAEFKDLCLRFYDKIPDTLIEQLKKEMDKQLEKEGLDKYSGYVDLDPFFTIFYKGLFIRDTTQGIKKLAEAMRNAAEGSEAFIEGYRNLPDPIGSFIKSLNKS